MVKERQKMNMSIWFTEKPKKKFQQHGENRISCVVLHSLLMVTIPSALPPLQSAWQLRLTYVTYQPNHIIPLLKTLPHTISPAGKGKALLRA